ncbi:MAG: hypothetical protein WKG07_18265 [Hymenobacter sp.]
MLLGSLAGLLAAGQFQARGATLHGLGRRRGGRGRRSRLARRGRRVHRRWWALHWPCRRLGPAVPARPHRRRGSAGRSRIQRGFLLDQGPAGQQGGTQ